MELEAAFERDLYRWLGAVYDRAEALARGQDRRAAERVVERQNRVYVGLIVILGASIMLLPWGGANGVFGALVVLYLGALISSSITAVQIRRLEHATARYEASRRRRDAVWASRPALGPDERAQLIRLMNLSPLATTATGRAAFARELSDLELIPTLAGWPPVRDAAALMEEPAAAGED